jgi:hypothetical protein
VLPNAATATANPTAAGIESSNFLIGHSLSAVKAGETAVAVVLLFLERRLHRR